MFVYIARPEAEQVMARCVYPVGSRRIVFDPVSLHIGDKLDEQFGFKAIEISGEDPERAVAPEAETIQTAVAEKIPEPGLGDLIAHAPRAVGENGREMMSEQSAFDHGVIRRDTLF